VPHDVVESKIGSKKKLVMQLDRDVQVRGIYMFVFRSTPCLEILFLLLFWRGSCFTFFMLFDWSTFVFSMLLEHILFFNDPSLLLQEYKKRNLSGHWSVYFWWLDGMFCVTLGIGVSLYMGVYVLSIVGA
jgi:hypothetical protein